MQTVDSSDHFSRKELECKYSGMCEMNPEFLARIEELRIAFGKPLRVTSGFRSPDHPVERVKTERGKSTGYHAKGEALDFQVYGEDAHKLIKLAIDLGFKGIGISQKGDFNNRFIHVDHRSEPALWSY